jgi:hypothetical protein
MISSVTVPLTNEKKQLKKMKLQVTVSFTSPHQNGQVSRTFRVFKGTGTTVMLNQEYLKFATVSLLFVLIETFMYRYWYGSVA